MTNKKILMALSLLAILSADAAYAFPLSIGSHKDKTEQSMGATITDKKTGAVYQLPPRRSRRRMLVDFGLFGAGVHVGWLKSKQAVYPELADQPTKANDKAGPIFNFSAGKHIFGIGRRAYE